MIRHTGRLFFNSGRAISSLSELHDLAGSSRTADVTFASTVKRRLAEELEKNDPLQTSLSVPILGFLSQLMNQKPELCKPLLEGNAESTGLLFNKSFLADVDRYQWLIELINVTEAAPMREVESKLLARLNKQPTAAEAAEFFDSICKRSRMPWSQRFVAADHLYHDFDDNDTAQLMNFFMTEDLIPEIVTPDLTPYCTARRQQLATAQLESAGEDDTHFFQWAAEQSCAMISSLTISYKMTGRCPCVAVRHLHFNRRHRLPRTISKVCHTVSAVV